MCTYGEVLSLYRSQQHYLLKKTATVLWLGASKDPELCLLMTVVLCSFPWCFGGFFLLLLLLLVFLSLPLLSFIILLFQSLFTSILVFSAAFFVVLVVCSYSFYFIEYLFAVARYSVMFLFSLVLIYIACKLSTSKRKLPIWMKREIWFRNFIVLVPYRSKQECISGFTLV